MSELIQSKKYQGDDMIVFESYGVNISTDKESIAKAFEK